MFVSNFQPLTIVQLHNLCLPALLKVEQKGEHNDDLSILGSEKSENWLLFGWLTGAL
jgi:hypothetical protein